MLWDVDDRVLKNNKLRDVLLR